MKGGTHRSADLTCGIITFRLGLNSIDPFRMSPSGKFRNLSLDLRDSARLI